MILERYYGNSCCPKNKEASGQVFFFFLIVMVCLSIYEVYGIFIIHNFLTQTLDLINHNLMIDRVKTDPSYSIIC